MVDSSGGSNNNAMLVLLMAGVAAVAYYLIKKKTAAATSVQLAPLYEYYAQPQAYTPAATIVPASGDMQSIAINPSNEYYEYVTTSDASDSGRIASTITPINEVVVVETPTIQQDYPTEVYSQVIDAPTDRNTAIALTQELYIADESHYATDESEYTVPAVPLDPISIPTVPIERTIETVGPTSTIPIGTRVYTIPNVPKTRDTGWNGGAVIINTFYTGTDNPVYSVAFDGEHIASMIEYNRVGLKNLSPGKHTITISPLTTDYIVTTHTGCYAGATTSDLNRGGTITWEFNIEDGQIRYFKIVDMGSIGNFSGNFSDQLQEYNGWTSMYDTPPFTEDALIEEISPGVVAPHPIAAVGGRVSWSDGTVRDLDGKIIGYISTYRGPR